MIRASGRVLTIQSCVKMVTLIPVCEVISAALGNGTSYSRLSWNHATNFLDSALVLYELTSLWNAKRSVVWMMAAGYILAFLCIGAFAGLAIVHFDGPSLFTAGVYACANCLTVEHMSILPGIPLCIFEADLVPLGGWIPAVRRTLSGLSKCS